MTTVSLNYRIVHRSPRMVRGTRPELESALYPRRAAAPARAALVSSTLQNETPLASSPRAKNRVAGLAKPAKRPEVIDRLTRTRQAHVLYGLIVLGLGSTACVLAAIILYILTT